MKKLKVYMLIVISSVILVGCAQSESALVKGINQGTSQVISSGTQSIDTSFEQDSAQDNS